ncbi:glycosyltransferase [Fusobacterium sp. THCT1E2]
MKILILGDFSGFGLNLKKGFEHAKKETILISNGDGWKKIPGSDLNLKSYYKDNGKYVNKIERIIIGIKNRKIINKFIKEKEKYFDIIFIINSGMFFATFMDYFRITFLGKDLKRLLKKNGKIYLSACGDDYFYLTYAKNILKYFTHSYVDSKKLKYFLVKEKKIHNYIDGIIPTMYDYSIGYKDSQYFKEGKVLETIPMPIDSQIIEYKKNEFKDKIIIFHGINREDVKGSSYIKEALERIKVKYSNKVEIIISEKLPLNKYQEILEKSNIILDQCKSYSYGMNAIYAMAMGKVVLSGNEIENIKELKREDIPVINIRPEVIDIEKKIEYLIENPNLIFDIGEKSRKFIEEVHDMKIVAKKYLEIFKNE